MKKNLVKLVVLLALIAVATPSFALEVIYGGQFWTRIRVTDNITDGVDTGAYDDFFTDVISRHLFGDRLVQLGGFVPGPLGNLITNAGTFVRTVWPMPKSNYAGHGHYAGFAFNTWPDTEDDMFFIDQRLRMYFTFKASENLQVVTKWEADTLWGMGNDGRSGAGGSAGNIGADRVILELKNAYVDFAVPCTPLRATVGVQGLALLRGWIIDSDFSAAVLSTKMDAFTLKAGYVAGVNIDVTETWDNVDDFFIAGEYAAGPFKAQAIVFYQNANEQNSSVEPGSGFNSNGIVGANVANYLDNLENFSRMWLTQNNFPGNIWGNLPAGTFNGIGGLFRDYGRRTPATAQPPTTIFADSEADRWISDNQLVDLGLGLEYKTPQFLVFGNFVKNFGGFDSEIDAYQTLYPLRFGAGTPIGAALNFFNGGYGPYFRPTKPYDVDSDYEGWMVDAGVNAYYCNFTFTLGGFYTSGGDVQDLWKDGDASNYFRYPSLGSASHYWSEIMGMGSLDDTVGTYANNRTASATRWQYGYSAADTPSNLWMIQAGVAWQALKTTKLTANYYYVGTSGDVLGNVTQVGDIIGELTRFNPRFLNDSAFSTSIGNEFDLYLDQKIVDGLMLRLIGAYMFTNEGYSILPNEDDVYELGAMISWSF